MKSPKESRDQLERLNRLLRDFDMFKGWVCGEAGFMLYEPNLKEKFVLDEYDADLIIKALGMLQIKARREVDENNKWCQVKVHVDIAGLQEKDKGRGKHKKKKKESGKAE